MQTERRGFARALGALCVCFALAAHADIAALPLPFKPVEVGHGTMRYFGLHIYDASLWSAHRNWQADAPYALQLTYARSFKGPTSPNARSRKSRRNAVSMRPRSRAGNNR
jgi:hypothetical protein